MIVLRSAILWLTLVLSGLSDVQAQPLVRLPQPVAAVMAQYKLPPASLSIFTQAIDSEQPLLLINADTPRHPASAIKLLTTYAALELLGPAYTWKTAAYVKGRLRKGRLQGDLILKGFGDPFLTPEQFAKLLRNVYDRGIRQIDGNLVIDNSYFTLPKTDPNAFDGQGYRAYNAVPSALMLNFQVVGFQFFPTGKAGPVRIVPYPKATNLTIQNNLKSSSGRCKQRRLNYSFQPLAAGTKAIFSGRYPSSCGDYLMHRVIMPSEQLVFGAFQSLWRELGGRFSGQLRTGTAGQRKPLYELRSQPLAELIRGMNKFSNNVMTRQLFLSLSAANGAPGSLTKSREVIKRWLNSKGLKFSELYIDNGSGLSRKTRIAARSLGRLLRAAYDSPYLPELQSSMPLAAIDGTLQRRFRGEELTGRLRLKTGTVNAVKAIAGYALSRSGRQYIVVVLHNHPRIDKGAGVVVQNALLRWLYQL